MLTTQEKLLARESKGGLTRCEMTTLFYMSTYMDMSNMVTATAEAISDVTGYRREMVSRAITRLLQEGYILRGPKQSIYRVTESTVLPQDRYARGLTE